MRSKRKKQDSEEEDFVVDDDEVNELEEEEDEEELVLADDEDDELELFDDQDDGDGPVSQRKPKKGRVEHQLTQFLPADSSRELEVDKEFLASLVSPEAAAAFANVKPRQSTEPQFKSDPKTHAKFAKMLNLQQKSAADDGDEGPSYESPFASIKRRSGVKYTPLEEQWLAVKQQHPDVILFVECGYRFKFFGADAITASNVLGIMWYAHWSFLRLFFCLY